MGLFAQLPVSAFDLALSKINQAQLAGEISTQDALIQSFYRIVDSSKLDNKFKLSSVSDTPIKCGTQIILEVQRSWDNLPVDFKSSYRHYFVAGYQTADANSYNSAGGNFTINWGTGLVDATDTSGVVGVPDVIELWASYFDTTYTKEVDEMGFTGPVGRYNIYIGNTNGSYSIGAGTYGYASSAGYIVVRENYNSGFPANTDPDGNNKGAMKVTTAHEFHHALQYLIKSNPPQSNAWWMEATSTWMEDAVFNQVNDYVNYLGSWSSYPYTSLTLFNGSHEYGDVIWSKYLAETYASGTDTDGSDVFLSVWNNVASQGALTAISTYLTNKGTSLKSAYHDFAFKNQKMDYAEGASYGTMAISKTESSYPVTTNMTTSLPDYLACNYVRFNISQTIPTFNLTFDGDDSFNSQAIEWKASVLKNDGATKTIQAITLDSFNQGSLTLYNLSSSDTLTLIASVVSPTGLGTYQVAYGSYPNGVPFSYSVAYDVSPAVLPLEITTALNYPNPITAGTTFFVQASRSVEVEIKLYDQRGYLVKTLSSSSGSPVQIAWDGRDSSGQVLANGVYFYRVLATDSEGNTAVKKGKCAILWKS